MSECVGCGAPTFRATCAEWCAEVRAENAEGALPRSAEFAETLRRMYWDERRSLDDIGAVFEVDASTVRRLMIQKGIPRRASNVTLKSLRAS